MNPGEIEALSFKIIDQEAGPHEFSVEQWAVVRRLIHTSADFQYMQTIRFHPDAIGAGIAAIRAGKPIITDTQMARAGIRRSDLKPFGVSVKCYMGDRAVHAAAKAAGYRHCGDVRRHLCDRQRAHRIAAPDPTG
jgi:precorrin-8X/cobalt-precorrin-8 methylmutase